MSKADKVLYVIEKLSRYGAIGIAEIRSFGGSLKLPYIQIENGDWYEVTNSHSEKDMGINFSKHVPSKDIISIESKGITSSSKTVDYHIQLAALPVGSLIEDIANNNTYKKISLEVFENVATGVKIKWYSFIGIDLNKIKIVKL